MSAPRFINEDMIDRFTMGHKIKLLYQYRDDSQKHIQDEINANFTKDIFEKHIRMATNREQNYYNRTDTWLYEALEKYPIKDKHVGIYGSTSPWYEAIAAVFEAKNITVIEHSNRPSFHKSIKYIKPGKEDEPFDAIFSISSFEHDGLGRYGDPINPEGDLQAMKQCKDTLKKDGLMFLSIPTGDDVIYFNVHRVYGEIRFNELIKGWGTVDSFGIDNNTFSNSENHHGGTGYQPVFVLKNE